MITNLASVKHHNFFLIEYQNAELLSCNALHHSTIYRAKTVSHCKTIINLIYLHLYQITKYSFTYSQSIFAQLATESFSRTANYTNVSLSRSSLITGIVFSFQSSICLSDNSLQQHVLHISCTEYSVYNIF